MIQIGIKEEKKGKQKKKSKRCLKMKARRSVRRKLRKRVTKRREPDVMSEHRFSGGGCLRR
jgi:hypothetical protein